MSHGYWLTEIYRTNFNLKVEKLDFFYTKAGKK